MWMLMFKRFSWFVNSPWLAKPSVDRFVGSKLSTFRLKSGYSQERVGAFLSLSATDIGRMEAGKKRISASQLFALSNYLNVPVAAFFDRREGAL